MKKLSYIIGIIIFIFSFYLASANNINIQTNSSSITIDKYVSLNIQIDWISSLDNQLLNINWIDKFDILSKSFSSSSISVNWNISNKYEINLLLKPTNIWDFQIWPVEYDSLKSNIVSLSVSDQVYSKDDIVNLNPNSVSNNISFIKDNLILIFLLVFTFLLIWLYYYLNFWFKIKNNKVANSENKIDNFDIIYPNIEDTYFIENIEKILKQILKLKFNYDFENNEYTILKQNLDKNWIFWFEEIIDIILELKYWNINNVENKTKLIYLLKNINGK